MRPVKTRPRFRCDFCRYTSSSVSGMEAHEKRCWRNPDRICGLCGGKQYYDVDYGGGPEQTPCHYCAKFDPEIAAIEVKP